MLKNKIWRRQIFVDKIVEHRQNWSKIRRQNHIFGEYFGEVNISWTNLVNSGQKHYKNTLFGI